MQFDTARWIKEHTGIVIANLMQTPVITAAAACL
jgi:hypothetical protein